MNPKQPDMVEDAQTQELIRMAQVKIDELKEFRDKANTYIETLRKNIKRKDNYIFDLEKQLADQARYVESDVREKYERQIEDLKKVMLLPDTGMQLVRVNEFVLAFIEAIKDGREVSGELLSVEYNEICKL